MEVQICQSCGMPLVEELKGCNRDKSRNEDYCLHCFFNGEFLNHSLTLHELEVKLLRMAEDHNEITMEEAQHIIKRLPQLKRWQMGNI